MKSSDDLIREVSYILRLMLLESKRQTEKLAELMHMLEDKGGGDPGAGVREPRTPKPTPAGGYANLEEALRDD